MSHGQAERPPVPPGPYLVAGAGRSGTAAAEALARRVGPEQLLVWDTSPGPAIDAAFDRLGALGIATTRAPARLRCATGCGHGR